MILHADGSSFYAACEQIYRPDLRGKSVAVLSDNDGIIIALNKEAKACGRHSITLAKSWTVDGWQMKREFLSPCVTTDILVVLGVR